MSKPKGKTPSLISGSNGKPNYVIAQRASRCFRCHIEIISQEKCVEIPKLGGPFTQKKRICLNCFRDILRQTKKDIEALEKVLI